MPDCRENTAVRQMRNLGHHLVTPCRTRAGPRIQGVGCGARLSHPGNRHTRAVPQSRMSPRSQPFRPHVSQDAIVHRGLQTFSYSIDILLRTAVHSLPSTSTSKCHSTSKFFVLFHSSVTHSALCHRLSGYGHSLLCPS